MGDKSLAYFLGDLNFLKRGRGMALNFAQLIPGAVCQRVEQASSWISLAMNVAQRALSLLPTDSLRPRDIGRQSHICMPSQRTPCELDEWNGREGIKKKKGKLNVTRAAALYLDFPKAQPRPPSSPAHHSPTQVASAQLAAICFQLLNKSADLELKGAFPRRLRCVASAN